MEKEVECNKVKWSNWVEQKCKSTTEAELR